jgi:O-antigen/teichoic acid export membrane protein
VAGQVLSALIAVALGCRLIPVKLSLWRHETERILFEALPMGGILVLFTIYNRADTLILSHFHSPAAVGFYGAAYKIYEVLITPAAYFANSVLPVISGYAVSNRQKLLTTYRKCFLALLFFGGLAALGNYLLAPVGILLIAGRDFLPAVAPLQILSLSLIVSYLNHLNGYTIVALGKQRLSLVIATIALATNIILNILLIPAYSYLAAAFITFLTEGLIALLSLFVVHRGLCATTSHAPRATSQKP